MLRALFMIGLFALLGIIALKLIFGVLGTLVGLVFFLLGVAIKITIGGGVIYLLIRLFSPTTARRIRDKWSGSGV